MTDLADHPAVPTSVVSAGPSVIPAVWPADQDAEPCPDGQRVDSCPDDPRVEPSPDDPRVEPCPDDPRVEPCPDVDPGRGDPADYLDATLDQALATVRANLERWGELYPGDCTVGGWYQPRHPSAGFPAGANRGWTTGFIPGMIWLAYELTTDKVFLEAGRRQLDSFARRIEQLSDVDTHDLGFLYSLSAVVPYHLLGAEQGKRAGEAAAAQLMTRFLEPAGIIQAWGDLSDPAESGRTIIDSLMNLPLLQWAADSAGRPEYAEAARRHLDQLRDHIIREDATTFHTYHWDPRTGAPLRGTTQQGFADDSCWSRGQAWGIYGFALAWRRSGDDSYLAAARRLADYFLDHLPTDGVPYWDLVFSRGDQPRDSSAAAIAVCGLDELVRGGLARYAATRDAILGSLAVSYTPSAGQSDALLLHGVYDMPKGHGVDEASLWGDYFYLEALMRLRRPDWRSYWSL